MSMRPVLYVMAKAPLMGWAKTRLAVGVGPVHAQRLYRAMVRQVLRRVQDPRWDTVLLGTPDRWLGRVPEWRGLTQGSQGGGDLTERLLRVFSQRGPAIVIGTDAPQVCAADIAAGFTALRGQDFVFGPADDGGFWLMGMNGPARGHEFGNVAWSTDTALADVRRNIAGDTAELRTLIDMDDVAARTAIGRVGFAK